MPMKKLTLDELHILFDQEMHPLLASMAVRFQDATHLVVAENLDMSSSQLGERTAMIVGPSNTYKTLEECEGKHLNDLPNQRQYFTSYCEL